MTRCKGKCVARRISLQDALFRFRVQGDNAFFYLEIRDSHKNEGASILLLLRFPLHDSPDPNVHYFGHESMPYLLGVYFPENFIKVVLKQEIIFQAKGYKTTLLITSTLLQDSTK